MKRTLALVLALAMIFAFAGCKAKDPHEGEPRFTGAVMNDIGKEIVVRTYDLYEDQENAVFVVVSKDTRDENNVEEYWQGTAVAIYYDGEITEGNPEKGIPTSIENVYAIETFENN